MRCMRGHVDLVRLAVVITYSACESGGLHYWFVLHARLCELRAVMVMAMLKSNELYGPRIKFFLSQLQLQNLQRTAVFAKSHRV